MIVSSRCRPQHQTSCPGVLGTPGQRPGGFGILMSRQLVDDLLYNERGNAVLFVKYL